MHRPLYRAIVLRARELHLAGATVLRGPMGFGRSSHLHNANILRLSLDLPIVVEIVDETQKITAFLPELDKDDARRAHHHGTGAGLPLSPLTRSSDAVRTLFAIEESKVYPPCD